MKRANHRRIGGAKDRRDDREPGMLERSIPLFIAGSPIVIAPLTPLIGTGWAVVACLVIVTTLAVLYGRRVGWSRLAAAPRWNAAMAKVGPVVGALIGLFSAGLVILWLAIPAGTTSECREAVREDRDLFLEDHVIRTAFGTRKYEDHWIVGMEAVPQRLDGQGESVLVVCHYETGGLGSPLSLQVLDPAQENHVRQVSRSVYRSWWPAEN